MKQKFQILLIVLLTIINSKLIIAQFNIDYAKVDFHSDFSYQKWTKDDGLPSNDTYDIMKSKEGFYYLGSSHGFVRFDGTEFKIFNTKNIPLIKANVTRHLFTDSKNRIWIANGGAGILIYKDGSFKKLSEDDGLSLNHPSYFQEDSSGKIYIGTMGGGLNIYQNEKFSTLNKNDGLTSNTIQSLFVDRKNKLWIGVNSQNLLYLENGKIRQFFLTGVKQFTRILKIYEDTSGTLWIGTDSGLFTIKDNISITNTELNPLSNATINNIVEDADKNIWIATNIGVYIYNGKRLIKFSIDDNYHPEKILYILINNDGIWMSGAGVGLLRLTFKKVKLISEEHGMPDKIVRTVYQDNSGDIWFGTNHGIASYKENSGKLTTYNYLKPVLIPYSFCSNTKKEIFIGTRNSGVWKFSNGVLKNFADKKVLGANFIRSLMFDEDNNLWIGTNGAGVAIYSNGKFSFINKSDGLKSDFVACIVKDKAGNFWIGTSGGGITILDKNRNIIKSITEKDGLASNIITSIIEDENGIVWVSTGIFGISRLKDGKIINIQEKDGIYSNSIKKMISDNNGKFWCTSEFGLFSLDQKTLNDYAEGKISRMTFNLFGKKDGMKSDEFHGLSNDASCLSKSGILYFPSSDGVVIVEPKKLQSDDEKPVAYIDDILVNNEIINKKVSLNFSPATEILQFNYGGISVNYGRNLSYKYLLEGFDKNFIDAGKRRQTFYTHLPYGDYKFKVITFSPNGNQSVAEATFNFTIDPYIWQTIWFRIGFVLLLISCSALILKTFYKRKYKRRMELLETEAALDRERMRISKDMHDELGASLTKISLMTELAKRNFNNSAALQKDLQNISDAGRDVAVTMDEIVWAVNPQNDNLDKMIGYIVQYIEDLMNNSIVNLK